ncbi:bifunctional hydroxymethylpyrimidine kinase/phosphomethylpyrimidine kinase [Virgibacillus doumboii]|uniref:bifunctional hydroxymethylpyrimidine kinase/phosphomethylpyrimidine kinase n=1 Tax=Virgibacillus doumboii TaxID=2697503 RepID=UPI0013DFF43A|nr:bifunctional hydroxymethylpyrimidine kinase/phosphomethylpyrimidine kinase [Virgibacillus doumboii]
MKYPSRVITIAGSAAGGSAGIQADLKTFQELDVYGMSVVTAIVARHPETDKNVHPQTIEAIEAQFATAVKQVGVDAVKTGMLFSKEVIDKTAEIIAGSTVESVVIDPVMVGKLDSKLLEDDAIEALKTRLLPMATVITPNMPEASFLLDGRQINSVADLKQAAIDLHQLGPKYVLVKGGRLEGPAVDVLYDGETLTAFQAPRIDTVNTSGAGCSYSAAITAYIAKGYSVLEAVQSAKSFVTTAIEYGFSYTEMVGPTYHAASRKNGEAHKIILSEERV